ncbi:hypothetical protein PGQ11_007914 [Apiospora arundinis]|uniref:BZIP domain-containing protein n=1 Tax=Apiospora arundinis TaxID=335852 RepID=A0ABR2IYU5_9PEZI
MDFDQQMLDCLAYELPQSTMGTICEALCIIASCKREPQQLYERSAEQDTIVKLKDIMQPQSWGPFSSASTLGNDEILDPVAPTPTSTPSTKRSVQKTRRDRARRGSSGGSTDSSKEKNRIAASKCRKKKKSEERSLEERRRILQVQNHILMDSAASLRAEVWSLKDEILRHGTCNFEPINAYIATAAARVG